MCGRWRATSRASAGAAAGRAGGRGRPRRRRSAPEPVGGHREGIAASQIDARAIELEVDGLRAYRDGSPASRIHWPAVARTGELFERNLVAGADAAPLVVLDATRPASPAALDAAVRAAASLCVPPRRAGGCAVLLPDDRRPTEIETDMRAWPQVHARLALVEAGGRRPRCSRTAAPGDGLLGHAPAARRCPAALRAGIALRYLVNPAGERRARRRSRSRAASGASRERERASRRGRRHDRRRASPAGRHRRAHRARPFRSTPLLLEIAVFCLLAIFVAAQWARLVEAPPIGRLLLSLGVVCARRGWACARSPRRGRAPAADASRPGRRARWSSWLRWCSPGCRRGCSIPTHWGELSRDRDGIRESRRPICRTPAPTSGCGWLWRSALRRCRARRRGRLLARAAPRWRRGRSALAILVLAYAVAVSLDRPGAELSWGAAAGAVRRLALDHPASARARRSQALRWWRSRPGVSRCRSRRGWMPRLVPRLRVVEHLRHRARGRASSGTTPTARSTGRGRDDDAHGPERDARCIGRPACWTASTASPGSARQAATRSRPRSSARRPLDARRACSRAPPRVARPGDGSRSTGCASEFVIGAGTAPRLAGCRLQSQRRRHGHQPRRAARSRRRVLGHLLRAAADARRAARGAGHVPGAALRRPTWSGCPNSLESPVLRRRDAALGTARRGGGRRLLDSPYARRYRLASDWTAGASTPVRGRARDRGPPARATTTTTPTSPRTAYPLGSFLFEDRAGYCQQFAGAMGLMLRMMGIPSPGRLGLRPRYPPRRRAARTRCATSTPTRGSRSTSGASAG